MRLFIFKSVSVGLVPVERILLLKLNINLGKQKSVLGFEDNQLLIGKGRKFMRQNRAAI